MRPLFVAKIVTKKVTAKPFRKCYTCVTGTYIYTCVYTNID